MKTKLAIATTAALLLVGCGGDKKLSKADFVKKADGICKKYQDQANAIKEPTSAADIGSYVDKVRPLIDDERKALAGIKGKAPDAVKDDFSKAVDLLEKQPAILDQLKAAGTNPQKLKSTLQAAQTSSDQGDALAKKIGLAQCGAS